MLAAAVALVLLVLDLLTRDHVIIMIKIGAFSYYPPTHQSKKEIWQFNNISACFIPLKFCLLYLTAQI